jgi:uncharacterized protein
MDYHDDRFEWDQDKAASNLRDHKVSFEDARLAFDDPRASDEFLVDDSDIEERRKLVGQAHHGLIVVVYTEREGGDGIDRTRIISARKANRHEQSEYNDG